MNVAGVFDAGALEAEVRGSDQERVQLIPAGRAVRADLIVERHDLVAVVRAEDRDVACIGLRDELLDRSDDKLAGLVRLERIASLEHLELVRRR